MGSTILEDPIKFSKVKRCVIYFVVFLRASATISIQHVNDNCWTGTRSINAQQLLLIWLNFVHFCNNQPYFAGLNIPPRTRLGELTTLSKPTAGFMGREGKGTREGEERKDEGKERTSTILETNRRLCVQRHTIISEHKNVSILITHFLLTRYIAHFWKLKASLIPRCLVPG